MIYLIDDRKNRQEDLGWSLERLNDQSLIISIYNFEQLITYKNKIFNSESIVLFHESFNDTTSQPYNLLIKEFVNDLNTFAQSNNGFKLIYFSGSKKSRLLIDNVAYLPVEILYQNINVFIKNYKTNDIKYLCYGENPQIEEILYKQLVEKNTEIESGKIDDSNLNNFVVKTNEEEIEDIFTNATNEIIFDDNITDEYLNTCIEKWFLSTEYDNIFVPLCFGATLSDYNGLKLASHIRCTDTPNRLKNIFIYGFVSMRDMVNNENFNILKTKNIFLIDYTKKAFQDALNIENLPLLIEELPNEINKLSLSIPKDINDNHSISNLWAIYRWSKILQINNEKIEKIIKKVDTNLYFKYLKSIFPIDSNLNIQKKRIDTTNYKNSKILYIDDEAEKGWKEIFSYIISDSQLNYISNASLMSKTSDEIIDLSLQEIIKNDIDIVILDFRLHHDDFKQNTLHNVTGYKILKKIKQHNAGIQVIIFSATNKVWNLLNLQEAGADGFIIKEHPLNSIDGKFTTYCIKNFEETLLTCLNKIFLKKIFQKSNTISINISNTSSDSDEFSDFLKDLGNQIKIVCTASKNVNIKDSLTLDIIFLTCYNFLEKFKNFYLKEIDNQFVLGIDEIEMNRYNYQKNKITNCGKFMRESINDSPTWFHTLAGLFIDYFLICHIDDKTINDLSIVKNMRNDYVHNGKNRFEKDDILLILSLCEKITAKLKE
ncbi:response regulator [Chryseobacterium salviniae]|uniref:Response regulator n=1 Tax=Chryseobacterium salviniae TaxID=3101750 RepID=A0ABU6HUD3_9FLAO|nr:response regulator [Chryseobacterium sp. T9W2-O]MEC3876483.1 response regulator [Chryseobacterium sp. T9W2-O]